jgi:hypothetical protein
MPAIRLTQLRRKIRHRHKRRIERIHQFSVHLRFIPHALPLWIILKRLPIRLGRFPARMLQNINQRIAFRRLIHRRPIRHTLHPMPLKQSHRVVAKPRQQLRRFPRRDVINPQFKNRSIRRHSVLARFFRRRPSRGRQQRRHAKRPEQSSSLHQRILTKLYLLHTNFPSHDRTPW